MKQNAHITLLSSGSSSAMTIFAKYFREINYYEKSYLNLEKKTTSNLDNLNITEMNIFIFWEENIAKCIYSHFSIKK